jgi:hypothetical protein
MRLTPSSDISVSRTEKPSEDGVRKKVRRNVRVVTIRVRPGSIWRGSVTRSRHSKLRATNDASQDALAIDIPHVHAHRALGIEVPSHPDWAPSSSRSPASGVVAGLSVESPA